MKIIVTSFLFLSAVTFSFAASAAMTEVEIDALAQNAWEVGARDVVQLTYDLAVARKATVYPGALTPALLQKNVQERKDYGGKLRERLDDVKAKQSKDCFLAVADATRENQAAGFAHGMRNVSFFDSAVFSQTESISLEYNRTAAAGAYNVALKAAVEACK